MKNIAILSVAFGMMSSVACADSIELPAPQVDNGITLYQALKNRHSVKEFSNEPVDKQMLSNILWVAYGVNREDGRRTIPTALNEKDLSIYVTDNKGVFLYNAEANALDRVSDQSLLPYFQSQPYMANVPVVLIYVGSMSDGNYAMMHAGSAYQNVGLYTATNDLGSVVRGYFDKEAVARALDLPSNEQIIISQAIGHEAN